MTKTAVEDEMPEDVGPEWVQMEIFHRYRANLLADEIGQSERLLAFWLNQQKARPDTALSFRIEFQRRHTAMLNGWLHEEQANEERAKWERERQYGEIDS